MIIYKDILTGDEIISDTYDLKDIEDVVYEVDCKMVNVGGDIQVDIGYSDGAKIAGAEGAGDEEGDKGDDAAPGDMPAQVNNIVDAFRLHQMPPYGKKEDFARSIKEYCKHLSNKLKEDGVDEAKIKTITDGIKKYSKDKIVRKLDDFEPYVGESFERESFETDKAMPIYLNFRPDGETPYFTIWKHGLVGMKV